MTPHGQAVWCEAYATGYEHGIAEGRRQAEAEDAAAWARMRETIHAAGKGDAADFAKVCERRGEHDRAERIRQLWTERGIGQPALSVIFCPLCHTHTSPWSCSCGQTRSDRGAA